MADDPFLDKSFRPAPETLFDLAPNLEIGPEDNRFRLVREIGKGGMARIWLAHDLFEEQVEGSERYKALKIVDPSLRKEPRYLELLKKEAARASELAHPNIINTRGLREGKDGWPFVVMDYLEGQDLHGLLQKEGKPGLPWERTLELLKPIAAGLSYAHDQKFIHCDLKPSNVFITQKDKVKLLDFGLVYRLRNANSMVNVQEIDFSGTPQYMPPEAFAGGLPDKARDIYALACLVFEMLTGQPPYIPEAAAVRSPELLPVKPRELTEAAWTVLKSGFAYRKQERPKSVDEFVRRLKEAQLTESTKIKRLLNRLRLDKPWLVGLAGSMVIVVAVRIYLLPTQEYAPENNEISEQNPPVETEVDPTNGGIWVTPTTKPEKPPMQNIDGWSEEKIKYLQQRTAEYLKMSIEFQDDSLGSKMVVIPAGKFTMGSPKSEKGRDSDEEPRHLVTIEKPFAIGKYEVTVGEFRRFVNEKNYQTEAEKDDGCYYWDGEWKKDANKTWKNPGFEQSDNHPVVCVSWNDAMAYADWLSEQTGQTEQEYRLPTEAEWEYAARAGTQTARYWEDDPKQPCRYANVADLTAARSLNWPQDADNIFLCEDSYVYTAPVGRTQASKENRFGLEDMLGNAWEWTCSEYEKKYNGKEKDCVGNNHASGQRVIRGGAWDVRPRDVRSATRGGSAPESRDTSGGFRLARNL